ncbi:MAG TPA: hypothetical protein VFQ54_07565, partial [Thermomicrobiales bacterium]|nr:hypothetical protein [Thermomicrobiales bacterium]
HFRAPLFGTFPMPPTLPGVFGQRIFGGEKRITHPGDALFRTLQKLMGDRGPTVAEVRTAVDDIDADAVDVICTKIQQLYASRSMPRGANPWRVAQNELESARALWSRS